MLSVLLSTSVCKAQTSPTLEKVRRAKALSCGIDQAEAEFSKTDDHGARVAFDEDLCKAVAVAALGPDARVITRGYPDDRTAMQALLSGEVDLIPTLTANFSHAAGSSVALGRPLFNDGVGFLVPASSGITQAAALNNRKICFLSETEVKVELRAWFAARHLVFLPFPFQEQGEMEAAYVTGNCTALAGDLTRLAQSRSSFGPGATDYRLLPEIISRDPLATAFRTSDPAWASVVQWTVEALIAAEELGITSGNVQSLLSSPDPAIRRLLGATHEIGRPLGLPDDWAARTIQAVGNYGQIFDRDLGSASPYRLPRGQNRLAPNDGPPPALPFK